MPAPNTSSAEITLRRTRIDAVLDNQRQRWTQGDRSFAEIYLEQHPWLQDDSDAVLDVIDHELILRTESGEKPTLDEYVRRFPQMREALTIQFALHESLRAVDRAVTGCQPTIDTRRDARQSDTEEVQLFREGSCLGQYVLLERIGQGGMGAVYLADDTVLKRRVALKVLRPGIAADDQARARFLREAQAAATIGHENVISVYQVGEVDGTPFIAMQHLQGETLQDRLQREPRIPWLEALRIGRDICQGLAAAHRHGLLHRDIKPSNLWLDRERGRAVILDFGLAHVMNGDQKITSAGTVLGTPAYMSPEQVTANPIGPQTDLYSLGVVLYQATTGRVPFHGQHILATLSALANQHAPPPHEVNPDIRPEFSDCVLRLLSKDPAQRPGSANELLAQLSALEVEPVAASTRPITDELHTIRQTRLRRGLLAAGLLSLLGGVAWLAAMTLKVETPDGVLTVQTDIKDVKLVVERGGQAVLVIDPRRQHRYRLEPGKYQVRLLEMRNGLVLETPEFVLKQDGEQLVKVKYEPKVSAAAGHSTDHTAAEWVLSHGGRVHVRDPGKGTLIEAQPGETLPDVPFQLVRVEFVGRIRVTDDDLARFENLAALEELRLEGTSVRGRGLTRLGHVKSLRHLSLPSTPFSDEDVEFLTAVPQLTELCLGGTAITDVGLERLSHLLRNLVYLRLERTRVNGTGLKNLQTLKQLRNLVLAGTSLKDEDVLSLVQMPALTWLDLRETPVTDRALDELIFLQPLRELSVVQTGATADGVRRFMQQRPDCHVEF